MNSRITIQPGGLARIRDVLPEAHSCAIISDENTRPYAQRIAESLRDRVHLLSFPAGEAHKTRASWQQLTDQMFERGLGRDSCVIAVGGGVTCDLAGFVAATYMRGVPVVQVPTSLLAMIDAAVGGKTGVDVPAGKNLVGAFHPPHHLLIDPAVLHTLPDTELSNGLAEAIKHGAIADAAYLEWITESATSIFERRMHTLESLIRRSVEIKTQFVEDDLREGGQRAALNFGHTIAHALEQTSGYAIPHGHAVALGMLIESEIGKVLGVTQAGSVKDIYQALQHARLPHEIVFTDTAPLVEATRSDKKARQGAVRYVLLERTGRIARTGNGEWTWDVADDVVQGALAQFTR
jgi:3-dehydroquinate synthase